MIDDLPSKVEQLRAEIWYRTPSIETPFALN